MEKLAKGIFFIEGSNRPLSSNAFVLEGEKRLTLIDSGARVDVVQKAIDEFNKPLETIFFTHGHFDHIHAALKAKMPGHMHAADLESLHELNAAWIQIKRPAFFTPLQKNKLKWDVFELDVIHTPGHTPGSVCFLEKNSKILFSGDTKFAHGGVGRTDFWKGSQKQLDASLKKLDALDYSLLAPGHGDLE